MRLAFINSLLDKMIYEPRKIKIAIFLSFCLLLILFGYFFSTSSMSHKLTTIKKSNEELKSKLMERQSQLNNLLKYKQKIAKMGASYGTIKKQLNQQIDVALLVKEIAKAANDNSVEINTIKPLSLNKKSLVVIYPLQLSVNSNYKKLFTFSKDLMNLSYFMVMQNIKIIRLENDYNELNLKALMLIYSVAH